MEFDFLNYMRNCAETLVDIQHDENSNHRFYRMTGLNALEEVLGKLLTAQVPAIGVIDSPDGRLSENNSDKIDERQYYIFLVMGRTYHGNFDAQEAEKRSLRTIALKIISKMKKDRDTDYSMDTTTGLRNLNLNSVSYRFWDRLPDGLIALAVSFTVEQHNALTYNPDDWT